MSAELLEKRCYELLEMADLNGFEDPYNELWDMFDGREGSEGSEGSAGSEGREAERMELSGRIAGVAYALGEYYHDRFRFHDLCGVYNDIYALTKTIPESEAAALSCVMLAVGVFELKFQMSDFENIESYINELLPVTARFPENEEFAVYGAISLCNLLQLCPYDISVFTGRMLSILDRIEELAGRFPGSADMQVCCLRSFAFFLSYGKPRLRDEIFEEYYHRAARAFADNEGIVAGDDLADIRYELYKQGIKL